MTSTEPPYLLLINLSTVKHSHFNEHSPVEKTESQHYSTENSDVHEAFHAIAAISLIHVSSLGNKDHFGC